MNELLLLLLLTFIIIGVVTVSFFLIFTLLLIILNIYYRVTHKNITPNTTRMFDNRLMFWWDQIKKIEKKQQ